LTQLKARRDHRAEAVRFLERQLQEYGDTSIGTRIRKNLNLLTIEGEPAPELDIREWLGPKPQTLSKQKGRPILMFFWAHYCEDSRAQSPTLVRIREKFESSGLALIGPTHRYGYLDEHRRKPATRSQERRHIEAVLNRHYSGLSGMPVPIGESNFYVYGASTTPTLVLIDRSGLVSRYHPGKMTYRELAGRIEKLLL
jgi:thiol-disulfide isomerase/thioredoxin